MLVNQFPCYNSFRMYWADRIAKEIVKSKKYKPYWLDDMKTPSGRVHVGSLMGILIHDLIYKALLSKGEKATLSYVMDDHDPMDGLPVYLDRKKYLPHMGKPLNTVPSPEPGFASYAEYFAKEFIEVFSSLGAKPKIIWASKLYQSGKMDESIAAVLDKAQVIRDIYKELYGKPKPQDWFPFQVICPKCGKVGTTMVHDWDGKKVTFRCEPSLVDWAKGCGGKGKISPFGGTGKIPWKIEWACKWKVIGVTIEGAGKDHMSAGGSHDVAARVCQRVLNYPVPYPFSHEFFLIEGKKMASSKGRGASAKEVAEIIPPYLLRFLIARVKYNRAIDFDPTGWTIPDLFDEYDRAAKVYWKEGAKKDLGRIFELSQPDGKPPKRMFLPRFRDVAQVAQMPNLGVHQYFKDKKGSKLTDSEKETIRERVKYAGIWLDGYTPKEAIFRIQDKVSKEAKKLSPKQKKYLGELAGLVSKAKDAPELEKKMYELAKKLDIPTKDAFRAVYLILLDKTHGPKAAWLIMGEKKSRVTKLLKEAAK